MVKEKQRHSAAGTTAAATSGKDREALMQDQQESDDIVHSELPSEDSWVVVKKQRINIIIPPLRGVKRRARGIHESAQLPLDPTTVSNSAPGLPSEMISTPEPPSEMISTPEPQNEMPAEVQAQPVENNERSSLKSDDIHRVAPSPPRTLSTLSKRRKLDPSNRSNKLEQHGIHASTQELNCATLRSHELSPTVTCGASRYTERRNLIPGFTGLNDGKPLLNHMMRRSNLERKLLRAGGLNQWLESMGLEQFATIFQGKKVSKFQLVKMSMQKLKEMGAHAVGPRRKLMHALDCLCQPNCFQSP